MIIKVLYDFNYLDEHDIKFKNTIEMINMISSIYQTIILVLDDKQKYIASQIFNSNLKTIIVKKDYDISEIIRNMCKECDWLLCLKNDISKVECNGNVIYSPIDLKGDTSFFIDKSYTEHAKNKKYYHDFSNYYMYTLANDTEKEADFLKMIFKKYLNKDKGNVLDCCCGVGRHSYLMAKDGFNVTGIDFSCDQISNAKKIHNHKNIIYKEMDVRNINLDERNFDMSYCMWTTYNYLSLDSDLKKFIISNYQHLKNGGLLVLDSKNIPRLDPHRLYNRYTEKDKFKMEILINKYVFDNNQNSQYFLFIDDDGDKKFFFDDEFVRFYTLTELKRLMSGYFEFVDVYGDFDMNPYDKKNSNRFITVFRKIS